MRSLKQKNSLVGMFAGCLLIVAGCTPKDAPSEASYSRSAGFVYVSFSTVFLEGAIGSGKPFFVLYLPLSHVSMPAISGQFRESINAKDIPSGDLIIVVRYEFGQGSREIDEYLRLLPNSTLPKDPYLVLMRERSEVSRQWIAGNEDIESIANSLLQGFEILGANGEDG